MKLEFPVGFGF